MKKINSEMFVVIYFHDFYAMSINFLFYKIYGLVSGAQQ